MKPYTPTREELDHLAEAIPAHDEKPLAISGIISRQKKPRMPAKYAESCIRWLAENGHICRVSAGSRTLYQRQPGDLYVDPDGVGTYTTSGRPKSFSVVPDNRFHRALRKLTDSQCVSLWMPDPKTAFRKKPNEGARALVTITPGPLLGLPRYVLMISVIGSGCRLIRLDKSNQVANLVLAGIPAKLAHVLMDAIHHVFKE